MAVEFDFSKIEAAIDRAVASLEKLDKTLAATAKQATAINRAFGSNKQFDAFVESLRKLDAVSASNFKSITDSLSDLVKLIGRMPASSGNLGAFVKDLKNLISGLNEIKTTKASQARFDSFVNGTVVQIENLVNKTRAITGIKESISNIRSISKIIKELNESSASPSGGTSATIADLVKALSSLTNIPSADGFRKSVSPLIIILRELSETKTPKANLDGIISFIDAFKVSVISLASIPTTLPDLDKSIAFFRSLSRVFRAAQPIFYTGVIPNTGVAKDIVKRMTEIAEEISKAKINNNTLDKIKRVGESFKAISDSLRSIKRISDLDPSILARLNDLRSGLNVFLSGAIGASPTTISKNPPIVNAVNNAKAAADQFIKIGKTLGSSASAGAMRGFRVFDKTLTEFFKQANSATSLSAGPRIYFSTARTFFTEFGLLIQDIAKSVGRTDIRSILGTASSGISGILSQLGKTTGSMFNFLRGRIFGKKPVAATGIMATINQITQIINALNSLASATNLAPISKLSTIFDNLSQGLNRLMTLKLDVPSGFLSGLRKRLGKGSFKQIKDITEVIKAISEGLSKITVSVQNVKNVNTLANGIKNMSQGIAALFDLSKALPPAPKLGFIDKIKKLFGKYKFDPAMARVIRLTGQTITEIGKVTAELGNVKDVASIGRFFRGVAFFVAEVNKVNIQDLKRGKFGIGGSKFDRIISDIKKMTGAFKGLKGVDLQGLEKIFPAITSFASTTKDIDFTKGNLKGFSSFTSELAKGIKNLGSIRIDASKINSLSNAISSLTGRFGRGGGAGGAGVAGGGGTGIFAGATSSLLGNLGAQAISTALSRFEGFVRRLLTFDSQIRNSLNSIGNSIRNFGRSADFIGRNILRNFGIQGLLSGEGLQSTAEFDHLLNQIQTFGNLTDEQTSAAEKFADAISQKYPQSAAEASAAILDLLKAGLRLEEIEFTLPNAADLSALGDIPIDRASGALITATNVFDDLNDSMEATFRNSNITANLFSAAADSSTASLEEIIQGFENVGPAAQAAGLDVSQTLATLATLSDRGLRGAEGGTGLRSALNALFNRPQARDQLAFLEDRVLAETGQQIDLALSDANGQLREFDDILDSINQAYTLLNLTEAERLASLGQLADTYGRNTLAILLNAGGYDEMLDRMNQVESAEERAQKLMDDFQGSSKKLTASIKTLTKNAFKPLLDTLKPFVDVSREAVISLINLPTALFEFASSAMLVGSVLATLAGAFLIATGAVIKFQGAITVMASSFISIFTRIPFTIALITGFAGTIAVLATAFVTLGLAVGGIALVFNEFRRVVRENIGGAGDAFNRFRREATRAFEALGPAFSEFKDVLESLFGGIFESESRVFGNRVTGFFDRLTEGAIIARRSIQQFGAFFEVFSNFVNAQEGGETAAEIADINSQLTRLSRLSIIKRIFGDDINAAGLRNVFRTMQRGFQDIGRGVQLLLSGGIGILFGEQGSVAKVKFGAGMLLKTFAKAISRITGIDLTESIFNFEGGNIREGLANFFKAILGEVKNLITENRGVFVELITRLITLATPVKLFNIAGFFLRVLGLDDAATVVEGIGQKIQDVIRGAINFAIDLLSGNIRVDFLEKIMERLERGDISGAIRILGNVLGDVIRGALGSLPSVLQSIGNSLNLQFLSDLGISLADSEAFNSIVDALGHLAEISVDNLADAFDGLSDLLTALNQGSPAAVAVLAAGLTTLVGPMRILSGIKILGIFTILTNALKNIQILLDGDVVKFIEQTLLDISADIISFLTGEDIDAEGVATKLEEGIAAIAETLPPLLRAVGDIITREFMLFGSKLVNAANDIRARFDQTLGPLTTGFGDAFFEAQTAIGTGDPNKIFAALADERLDDTAVDNLVVQNRDAILAAIQNATGDLGVNDIPRELFNNMATVLGEGLLTSINADSTIPEDWVTQFFARILAGSPVSPEEARQIVEDNTNFRALTQGIVDAYMQGTFSGINDGSPTIGQSTEGLKEFIRSFLGTQGLESLTSEEIARVVDSVAAAFNGADLGNRTHNRWVEVADSFREEASQPLQMAIKTDVTVEAASVDASPLAISVQNEVRREVERANLRVNVDILRRANDLLNPRPRNAQEAFREVTGQVGPFPKRGNGGSLNPYSTYGVHDTTRPELATFADGTSLLFTGAAKGRMVKIMGRASAPAMNPGEQFISDYAAWRKENRKSSVDSEADNLEEIGELLDDIGQAFVDFVSKENEARAKHHQEVLDDERQYNHDRENIISEGRETLLEAIRRGDGAAALQAVKNSKKQLKELAFNAETQQIQRDRNLEETLKNLRIEYNEKVAGYEEQIAELRASNAEMLAEDQEFYDEEFTIVEQHHDELTAEQMRFNREIENNQRRSNTTQLEEAERGDRAFGDKVRGMIENIFNNLIAKLNSVNIAVGNLTVPGPGPAYSPVGPGIGSGGGTGLPNPPPPSGAPQVPGNYFGQIISQGGKSWIWVGTRWQEAFIQGRARGGIVQPNNAYEIFDTNNPEIMNIGGRSVLLSGKERGRISPIHPNYQGGGSSYRSGDVYLDVTLGDINSNASDPSLVADEVLSTVLPEIERIARLANRSNSKGRSLLDLG